MARGGALTLRRRAVACDPPLLFAEGGLAGFSVDPAGKKASIDAEVDIEQLVESLTARRESVLEWPEGAARNAVLGALDELIIEVSTGAWPRPS